MLMPYSPMATIHGFCRRKVGSRSIARHGLLLTRSLMEKKMTSASATSTHPSDACHFFLPKDRSCAIYCTRATNKENQCNKLRNYGFTCYPIRSAQFIALVDRKSTRLNSSHLGISYAVFC